MCKLQICVNIKRQRAKNCFENSSNTYSSLYLSLQIPLNRTRFGTDLIPRVHNRLDNAHATQPAHAYKHFITPSLPDVTKPSTKEYTYTLSPLIAFFVGLIVCPTTCYNGRERATLKIDSLWTFSREDVLTHHKSFYAPIIIKWCKNALIRLEVLLNINAPH
jgi:hypothetical protein